MKILIVDDEVDLRELLSFNLQAAGYETYAAASAEEALELLTPDTALILLDVMLPGMSGFHLADHLRKQLKNTVPIIFLTARSTENDLLTGFSTGGDDFIAKPFSLQEVLARIKAVLKRTAAQSDTQDVVDIGPLRILKTSQKATIDGVPLELSRKEFELLYTLAQQPGAYFSREKLISTLWKDTPFIVERTVDVHIARIRNKLGAYRDMIQNKTGFGYFIKPIKS
ncbi:MAG: response regulator transcription factor [Bacteroidales bacterium]|nr:response regulator transcription factor [Bacteroidales bacterium]